MIDADVMQDRIRDANPIPHVENLDADELAHFVAATHVRRAAAMQAPTQEPTPTNAPPTAPPPRRHRVWAFAAAFVLILVVVGAAALILGGDDAQVIDQPAPSTTLLETPTSVVETPTTLAEAPPPTVAFNDAGSWAMTRLSEPWTRSIVDVASLPSGGFVVAARSGVFWSPDGVEWFNADPQQQITAAAPRWWMDDLSAVISVVGDRVVVLDGIDPGLWIGDPRAGEWESIRLDTAGIAGRADPFAVASNDTEVLVLAEHRPKLAPGEIETVSQRAEFESAEKENLVWLVKPHAAAVEWRSLTPTRVDPGGVGRGGMGQRPMGVRAW